MQLTDWKTQGQATLTRVGIATAEEAQNAAQEKETKGLQEIHKKIKHRKLFKWAIFNKNSCLQSMETYLIY